jgi:hypothetical protein
MQNDKIFLKGAVYVGGGWKEINMIKVHYMYVQKYTLKLLTLYTINMH